MSVIDKAVQWAIDIANDESHGYDQSSRWGPNYDCSSFVISAFQYAGIPVKDRGATTTYNMKSVFLKCGFTDVINSVNISTGEGTRKGDVLLNEQHHTSLVVEDGGRRANAGSNEFGGVTGGQTGDQTGNEICIKNYSNYSHGGWNAVLRYTAEESEIRYTQFPKYELSESTINAYAGIIVGECGGDDVLACRQMATLYINRNEVFYGRSNTEEALKKIVFGHEGIGSGSWDDEPTQTAIDAVKFVISGKRVLPRYVTNTDCMSDINYPKDRSSYKKMKTEYNSRYMSSGETNTFYCFCGSNENGDVLGYRKSDYDKYKDDVAWTEGADSISVSDISTSDASSQSLPITKAEQISYIGEKVKVKDNLFDGRRMANQSNIELYLANKDGTILKPVVSDEIVWETPEWGFASLSFTCIKDELLNFTEGTQVIFKYQGTNVFCGYVFEKSRSDNDKIKVTAYDQLRYFNNKDIYCYDDYTATGLLKWICDDHSVKTGNLQETSVILPQTVCDNISLFDIMEKALDYTIKNGGMKFILFDDFGKISLTPQCWYRIPYVLNSSTCQDIDYTSSINDGTFNSVKLYYDNGQTGTREYYVNDKSAEFGEWGLLQYTEKLEEGQDGIKAAENLVKITTNKTRKLTAKKAFGDVRVRGGCQVYVDLNLGDLVQQGWMSVSGIKHTFSDSTHFMDIDLIGGQFI